MTRRIVAAAALLGLLLAGAAPGSAAVGDDTTWFRLGVFGGYRLAGDLGKPSDFEEPATTVPLAGPAPRATVESASAWGFRAAVPLGDRFEVQALFSRSRTSLSAGVGETWSTVWTGGLSYRFVAPGRSWVPFLGLSAGGHTFTPRDPAVTQETWFAASLDGGTEFPVGSRFALRVEVRGTATRIPSGGAFCSGADCAVSFREDSWSLIGEAVGGFVFAF